MTRHNLPLAALILFITCTSCRWFAVPRYNHEPLQGDVQWLNYDATRRGGFVLPADSKHKVIAEPAPDAIVSSAFDLLAKADLKGESGEVQVKYAENVAELASRHETVLVLREALYRLSELNINQAVSDADHLKAMYEQALSAVTDLATASKLREKRKLAENILVRRRVEELQHYLAEIERLERELAGGSTVNGPELEAVGIQDPPESTDQRLEALKKRRDEINEELSNYGVKS